MSIELVMIICLSIAFILSLVYTAVRVHSLKQTISNLKRSSLVSSLHAIQGGVYAHTRKTVYLYHINNSYVWSTGVVDGGVLIQCYTQGCKLSFILNDMIIMLDIV